ncbi:hypothetical protein BpHYR1_040315 [Brachionus plicatilis]|uniref:Uncharacterized protein n=1 Tax=Brachionus plicatilis TaxID=10195 RepID=A0A3M7R8F1_BRAPC|nr:hypothetical protein BpHYR1_040315 [Brachionus plicatilis]
MKHGNPLLITSHSSHLLMYSNRAIAFLEFDCSFSSSKNSSLNTLRHLICFINTHKNVVPPFQDSTENNVEISLRFRFNYLVTIDLFFSHCKFFHK